MKLRILELTLAFKRNTEVIEFADASYFYGQMGAGKSSIARLIDYCLGGGFEATPALQNEFTSAELKLELNGTQLVLARAGESNRVRARWGRDRLEFDVALPVREAGGEVLAGTGVEVLSDLLFYLAGVAAPRVMRGRESEDPELTRLSVRDLLWYCYLDQDSMDSSFFHLEAEANTFKRLKSRDVLRHVVGIHQEGVAELELRLEEVRGTRLKHAESARALRAALSNAGISSEEEVASKIAEMRKEVGVLTDEVNAVRAGARADAAPAADGLRTRARSLGEELSSVESAVAELRRVLPDQQRYLNELETLSVKADRAITARAVLDKVAFSTCPSCSQRLPRRDAKECAVCGQERVSPEADVAIVDQDLKARSSELKDLIDARRAQLRALELRGVELAQTKSYYDHQLAEATQRYDSIVLSQTLELEHRRAAQQQEIANLERLLVLPRAVSEQESLADQGAAEEAAVRRELKAARAKAEKDARNVRLLEELFVDCLVESGVPGFSKEDVAIIGARSLMPVVKAREAADLVVTSFDNLGSGGKKTLFKCCFAVALHRVAAATKAPLPSLMIIDSPMKNISERENREQFERFHQMLYRLLESELAGTQLVLIDKEMFPPKENVSFSFKSRHMTPGELDAPPLIPYYRGK